MVVVVLVRKALFPTIKRCVHHRVSIALLVVELCCTMRIAAFYWLYFLSKNIYYAETKYIIDLHKSKTLSHDRREFSGTMSVCNQPIISDEQGQTPWTCDQEPVEQLGYPRQTRCHSRCLDGYSMLHGTASTIECVDRRPQYGQTAREWNPKPLFCKPDTCDTSTIRDNPMYIGGRWEPDKCALQQKVNVGMACHYTCDRVNGIFQTQPIVTVCNSKGRWTTTNNVNCNDRLEKPLYQLKDYAHISQNMPEWSDSLASVDSRLRHHDPQQKSAVKDNFDALLVLQQTAQNINNDGLVTMDNLLQLTSEGSSARTITHKAKGAQAATQSLHKNMHNILTTFTDAYHGSSVVTFILVTILVVVIISLIIAISVITFKKKNVPKYVIVDEGGNQLLPASNRNFSNNVQMSESQPSNGSAKSSHYCGHCPDISNRPACHKNHSLGRSRHKRYSRPASDYSETNSTDSEEPLLRPHRPITTTSKIREVKLVLA